MRRIFSSLRRRSLSASIPSQPDWPPPKNVGKIAEHPRPKAKVSCHHPTGGSQSSGRVSCRVAAKRGNFGHLRISIWRFRSRLASRLRRRPASACSCRCWSRAPRPIAGNLPLERELRLARDARCRDPARRGGGGRDLGLLHSGRRQSARHDRDAGRLRRRHDRLGRRDADLPPLIKWAAAIIAGGGIAGLTQG